MIKSESDSENSNTKKTNADDTTVLPHMLGDETFKLTDLRIDHNLNKS